MEFDPRHQPACWFSVRHGVLNAEMVHGLYYEHLTLESLEREFRTLRRGGLLRRFVDTEGRVYYLPTERLCTQLGAHRSAARGRGAHTVAKRVGATWFSVRHGLFRPTAREFREQYPRLHDRKIPAGSYYVDTSREPHLLGWLEVDTGRNLRRLLQKVNRLYSQRFRLPEFGRVIHAQQFLVVILTPHEGKKQLIEARLDDGACGDSWVAVEVVPELRGVLLKERSN
jgi:hypothetical protein